VNKSNWCNTCFNSWYQCLHVPSF